MRILLVTTRYPWPPRRGLELRALQFAEWLAGEHAVTVLAPAAGRHRSTPPAALPFRLETYAQGGPAGALWGLGRAPFRGWPAQAALYARRSLATAIRHHAAQTDLAILQLVRLAPHLDAVGAAPLAVDLIDSLGLSFRRRAEVDRPWRRWLWRAEARRLERWEREMVRRAAVSWVVSERDRDHLVSGRAPSSRLQVLPPGVEADDPPAEVPSADAAPLLAVTGNLGYFATAEGLRWWLDEVWPLARARYPALRLLLAGARPPAWLRRGRHPAVSVARDPEDLRPLLAAATVALVPGRAGAGVPMKILEAWAAGVPVIAHPWSAAGAGAVPGEDLLTAETPAEWLAALARLLGSPAERRRLAAAGREHLRAAYAPAQLAARLRETVRALA